MTNLEKLLDNEMDVLAFLKSRYPIYHLSNIFFRDIQYGIQTLLEINGERVRSNVAEAHARKFVERLEKQRILIPIDRQSWTLHKEDYRTVAARKPAPAKPAPEKAAAPRPSGGLPPLKGATPAAANKPSGTLPPLKSATPAGTAKPAAGLPPLKSAAPAGAAKPVSESAPSASAQQSGAGSAPVAPVKETPPSSAKEAAPGSEQVNPRPTPASGKGGLPPITSSVPAGGKK